VLYLTTITSTTLIQVINQGDESASEYIAIAQQTYPRNDTIILSQSGPELNYESANPFLATGRLWIRPYEDMLVYVDNMKGSVEPFLATNWTYNEDYTQLTMELREDVKWSDGEPFTSEDVKFTVDALIEYGGQVTQGPWAQARIASIETDGPYTIIWNLADADPRFHLQFGLAMSVFVIVPKHIWEDVDVLTFTNMNPQVGLGPYTIIHAEENLVVRERNPHYYGYTPPAKYLIVNYVGSLEKRIIAQAKHEIDNFYGAQPSMVEILLGTDEYGDALLYNSRDPCPQSLWINCRDDHYPLNITEVRQAINLVINRKKVADYVYESSVIYPVCDLPWPGGTRDTNCFVQLDQYKFTDLLDEYDVQSRVDGIVELDAAADLLESIGCYKDESGKWFTADGTKFQFTIKSPPYEVYPQFGLSCAEDLNEFGFDVVNKIMTSATFAGLFQEPYDWDFIPMWTCGARYDAYEFYERLHSRNIAQIGSMFGNVPGWSNATHDALVDQLMTISPELDWETAEPLYRQLLEIYLQEMPIIPCCQKGMAITYDTYYWEGWPTDDDPYDTVGMYFYSGTLHLYLSKLQSTGRLEPGTEPTDGDGEAEGFPMEYVAIPVVIIIVVAVAAIAYRRR
jgi:peptide/nickel transport system substrate-binding protein